MDKNKESVYLPATYTNIINRMLARGAQKGQGGHLEANPTELSHALARLDVYGFMAAEIAKTYGMDKADALLRTAIRVTGRHRGDFMRRNVERRGLPLDAQRLQDYWDYTVSDAVTREWDEHEPEFVYFDVPGCCFHDQMREICPPQLMLLMCEEIHVAVAKEYNPAIQVWYQSLLTRGEAKCSFRFSMRREDAIKAAELAQGYAEQAQKAGKTLLGERQPAKVDIEDIYRPLAEVIVVFYHYVIDTLLRMVGENETEAIARRAMQAFGAWRGKTMREDHEQRGWPLNLESFITYYDDPAAGDAWVAENVSLSPTEHSKDIVVSPYATSFDKIGTGRFAAFYFDEALPAQAAAYNPALTVEIPLLMERGDAITRLHYHLKT